MSLVRYRPEERYPVFDQMTRMLDEVARSWREEPTEMSAWSPSVNIFEKDGDIVVEAELPGIKKENIEVRVENGVLSLKGERKEETKVEKENFYRQERFFGTFVRSFQLPSNVESEKIEASFKDGVLTLRVPRSDQAKPKRIAVH